MTNWIRSWNWANMSRINSKRQRSGKKGSIHVFYMYMYYTAVFLENHRSPFYPFWDRVWRLPVFKVMSVSIIYLLLYLHQLIKLCFGKRKSCISQSLVSYSLVKLCSPWIWLETGGFNRKITLNYIRANPFALSGREYSRR